MATVIRLNFDDAPPAQGGGGIGDHIPSGGYLLKVNKMSITTTQTGKQMIVAEYRTEQNKRITENFVIPRENTDDSKFPLQRFHAFIVACGVTEISGQGFQNMDLEKMYGLTFVGDIVDEEIPAQNNYPARMTSRPNSYYRVGSEEATRLLALTASSVSAPTADAPAPAPAAPVTAAPIEAPTVTPPTEGAAALPAAPATPPAAAPAAPAASPQDSVEAELDGLFSSS